MVKAAVVIGICQAKGADQKSRDFFGNMGSRRQIDASEQRQSRTDDREVSPAMRNAVPRINQGQLGARYSD